MRFNMNYHEEVCKLMFADGFDQRANHGLWKLKVKISPAEWGAVKEYFNFYEKDDKFISNSKYFGWATVNPVQVMKILLKMRN